MKKTKLTAPCTFETLENRRVFAALAGTDGVVEMQDSAESNSTGVLVGSPTAGRPASESPSNSAYDPKFTGGVRMGFTGGVFVSAGDLNAGPNDGVIIGKPSETEAAEGTGVFSFPDFTGGVRIGSPGEVQVGSPQNDGILIASSETVANDEVFRQLGSNP